MANLTQTAASVAGNGTTVTDRGTAGATIEAGDPIYIDADDNNEVKPAEAGDTAAKAAVAGIALNGAAAGQPVIYQRSGNINLGATLTVGEVYVLSATAGAIAPIGDLVSTDYVTVLGVATTAALLRMGVIATGIQKA